MPANDRQRVAFGRVLSLATKTSEQGSASLRFANAQVSTLVAQMEARRKAADRGAAPGRDPGWPYHSSSSLNPNSNPEEGASARGAGL